MIWHISCYKQHNKGYNKKDLVVLIIPPVQLPAGYIGPIVTPPFLLSMACDKVLANAWCNFAPAPAHILNSLVFNFFQAISYPYYIICA